MSKHGLEGVSVVWWFILIFTICRVYAWVFEFNLKGILEHVKTWLGRRFCCLVIYANLHNLPCICVKMAPTRTFFFIFLWLWELKAKKGSLEHVKTWFGRCFCCLVMYANSARFGKFFLLLIYTICRVYASKWLFWKFYEYFLDFLANVGTRGLRISRNMVWKMLLLFWWFKIYAYLC